MQLISNTTTQESTKKIEGRDKMSAKYAFSNTLKEVRFLFCQTGEHSGPTRFVSLPEEHRDSRSIAFRELGKGLFERARLMQSLTDHF